MCRETVGGMENKSAESGDHEKKMQSRFSSNAVQEISQNCDEQEVCKYKLNDELTGSKKGQGLSAKTCRTFGTVKSQ